MPVRAEDPPRRRSARRRVTLINRQRRLAGRRPALEAVLERILDEERVAAGWRVEVSLLRDPQLQAVNRRHLGRDRPTDVLAFPYHRPEEWRARAPADPAQPEGQLLGEVLISADQAAEQARRYRTDPGRRLAHLAIHGLLHLLGYDHHRPGPARRMRRRTRRHLDRWRRLKERR
ncbi:MAG: rRNA maturation RNase YbeY [Candidatus Eisenbacteria bacterium]|nr:rRNA maturation RNase YbeY [Candidatus Eisenbacteria bacterium]